MVINKSNIMMIKEIIITPLDRICKHITNFACVMLRVSLNAEETVTVFPALFFIRRQAEGG